MDFCGPVSHLKQSTILDLESISKSKKKNLLKSVQKQRNYAIIKNAKIVMFKMDVRISVLIIELLRFSQGT